MFDLLQAGCKKSIRDTEYFKCSKSCINVFQCLNISAENFVWTLFSPVVLLSALSLYSWFWKSFSYNFFLTILFHFSSVKVCFYFQKSEHFFFIDRFLVKVPSYSRLSLFKYFRLNFFWHYSRYNVSLGLPPTNRMLWAMMTTRGCVKVFITLHMQPHFRST